MATARLTPALFLFSHQKVIIEQQCAFSKQTSLFCSVYLNENYGKLNSMNLLLTEEGQERGKKNMMDILVIDALTEQFHLFFCRHRMCIYRGRKTNS